VPTTLTLDDHLAGLRAAVSAFVAHAERAGLDAGVPTCPDWTVRRLLAHQGMVHRWAAAAVRGERVEAEGFEREGLASTDPVGWLREGADEVVASIETAADDVRTVVFLNDAPPPRRFWARRQCHETTMHAVDALSADLGRRPRASDTWIDPVLARDGIDELLGGFLTRNHSRLRCEDPMTVLVAPTDADESWRLEVSLRPAVTTRRTTADVGAEDVDDADVVLSAPSVALYLALWNRSDEVEAAPDLADLWRTRSSVTWS
jgi:uncharacterized protein (TIGR03083 family)